LQSKKSPNGAWFFTLPDRIAQRHAARSAPAILRTLPVSTFTHPSTQLPW
jgi:hypothetical protein